MFFFEKKNQKTLVSLVPRRVTDYAPSANSVGAKVFCFFFSKKKAFLSREPAAHDLCTRFPRVRRVAPTPLTVLE
jgi:hypothetical protein